MIISSKLGINSSVPDTVTIDGKTFKVVSFVKRSKAIRNNTYDVEYEVEPISDGSFLIYKDIKISVLDRTLGTSRLGIKNYAVWTYNIELEFKDRKTTFTFTTSINDFKEGKIFGEKEHDFLWALQCFLEDAEYSKDGFENFCNNLGYNRDSIKALETFHKCQESLIKVERLGIDLDNVLEALRELEL